jgi:hypothetical protein
MRTFQDAASELALLRVRMHHSTADAHAAETERQLLETLTSSRQGFLQPVGGAWPGSPSRRLPG